MKIYNTLSGKREVLRAPKGQAIRLFVCGPTVYDYSHIGHARTYIAFDIAVRWLKASGFNVFYLQNITDVDDKIINRAESENKNPLTLARFFEKEYRKDMRSLGIVSVDKYARAAAHLKEIKKQIAVLLKKGFAYQTKNGVYFEVKKFNGYGKLSRQNLEETRRGWRIEPDPEKKDPLDFALWKNRKSGELAWPSPWGAGRPGWHIEDTAIAEKFFGPRYDIHGGAVDLKFPHHESEIAQAEAASGKKPFVKIWMHAGFLLVGGEKMSKSSGNFITIRDFLKNHDAAALRLLIASHHYRSPVDYSESLVQNAENSLKTIAEFLGKAELMKKREKKKKTGAGTGKRLNEKKYAEEFRGAMNDDFNAAKALAVVFDFIASLQRDLWTLSTADAKKAGNFVREKLSILGIEIKTAKIPLKIKVLAEKREKLRRNKQFIPADHLRKTAESLGYSVEDTPAGPYVKPLERD
ncbi:MAG: cysteine--tRNA ligase [Parcubacteria group bacterium]|nr:cysteine--tRNA ligase [Parcubacteria group bacterium]